jgi:Glycosyl hydrolase family 76
MTEDADPFLERATEAWRALLATCTHRDGDVLGLREAPRRERPAPVWPLSQAIAAGGDLLAAGVEVGDDLDGLIRSLRPYARRDGGWAPTPRAHRRYFDDNAWIGLASVRLHGVTRVRRDLDRASRALGFVMRGEDPAGGVRWAEGRRSRNTCATAPGALLALRMHGRTGDGQALDFATRSLGWLDATLRRPDRLYADRIDGDRVERTVWSYNQGSTAAAHIWRHRAIGDRGSRDAARAIAAATVTWLARDDRLWHQPPVFNAIAFRGLLAVHDVTPVPGLLDMVDAYLDRAWREARDPDTGLFTRRGIGSYDGRPAIDQAGLAQLFAVRASGPGAWFEQA